MAVSAPLRALLERSIDYAGLFPPASLALEPALRNHAGYVGTSDSWMLGAFILPAGQFDAASENLSPFSREHPLRISALGTKTDSAADFLESLGSTRAAIGLFMARHGATASISQLEMPLPAGFGAELFKGAHAIIDDMKLNAFWEAPADAAERTIKLIAEHNRAPAQHFGYKLRTGGVTADAFPSSDEIAAALVAAAKHHVPIKFTAGLHHPVRQFHASVQTNMHGFLNVLGAGVLAAEHGWEAEQTAEMLDDEDPGSFSFEDGLFAWREWTIAIDRIKARRHLVTSFGSCSFDEPREDLRALKLF
jgi:hypothetical protein